MSLIWKCMFAPRLYKIYRDGPKDSQYQPQGLEKWSDKVVSTANTLFGIGLYTSPFIGMYVWRRGFFSSDEAKFLVQCFGGISCLLVIALALRSVARSMNPKYVAFVNVLYSSETDRRLILEAIRRYDFEFIHWPVTFRVAQRPNIPWLENPFNHTANPELPTCKRFMIQLMAYAATHVFGLRLIYPGSLAVINHVLWNTIFQGRVQLVENFNGLRAKIATADLNHVDTMFVDNRAHSVKGRTLVICCEGNSGFYEVGIMSTPAKAGYSVLGWNHPGFGGSTGKPYPSQEHNAVDAVMQYAIVELGFQPEDVVMYGWSIGGYTATWIAVNYPVKGLILDATFDDLLPLAEQQMPSSWSLLVKEVVRCHVNLNVAELLVKYAGPVQLIRRTEDEIICLRQGQLSTNRGNNLLIRLIESRHRTMHSNTRDSLRHMVALDDSQRAAVIYTTVNEYEQRAVRLIGQYMRDFKSTHCMPISQQQFESVIEVVLNTPQTSA